MNRVAAARHTEFGLGVGFLKLWGHVQQELPGASDREYRLLVVIFSAVVFELGLLYFPLTHDAAYITFRYAEHLAEGHGIRAWNLDVDRILTWTAHCLSGATIGGHMRTAN